MRDDSVGFEYMADYLLYLLNRHQMFEYVNILGLDAPSDDIRVVLATYALSQGFVSVKTDLATGKIEWRLHVSNSNNHKRKTTVTE